MKRFFVILIFTWLMCLCVLAEPVKAANCPPCTDADGFVGLNTHTRNPADIVGSKLHISFHDVELCNENEYDPSEPLSRPYNHSTVWTQIVGHNPNVSNDATNVYIQTGWLRYNREGETPSNHVYVEAGTRIGGVHSPSRYIHPTQAPAGTKEYRLEQLNKSTGRWEVYYRPNTAPWFTQSFDFWKNTNGKKILNQGEVNLLESDMAGIASNKCGLRNLKYLREGSGSWYNQDTEGTVINTHSSRFGGTRVTATEVQIWDKQDDCN